MAGSDSLEYFIIILYFPHSAFSISIAGPGPQPTDEVMLMTKYWLILNINKSDMVNGYAISILFVYASRNAITYKP